MGMMPQLYYDIKRFLKHKHRMDMLFEKQYMHNIDRQIQHWNWCSEDSKSMWWMQHFIVKRGLLDSSDKRIALCSVFGEREVLDKVDADVRVFFSGENLHHPHRAQYADYMLSGKHPFDLGLGFDVFENDHYLRFPLWLTYMFEPDATVDDINNRCEQLRHPVVAGKNKFCALVARGDRNGVRTALHQAVSRLGSIDCPSALFHNDDCLIEKYQDDKITYLRQYVFNICPENTASYGYTTEKLFQSIAAGCIPVYWGNDCLDIVNPSIVLFWNREGDEKTLLDRMADLMNNKQLYGDFTSQDWLMPNAAEFVISKFAELESRLKRLLN